VLNKTSFTNFLKNSWNSWSIAHQSIWLPLQVATMTNLFKIHVQINADWLATMALLPSKHQCKNKAHWFPCQLFLSTSIWRVKHFKNAITKVQLDSSHSSVHLANACNYLVTTDNGNDCGSHLQFKLLCLSYSILDNHAQQEYNKQANYWYLHPACHSFSSKSSELFKFIRKVRKEAICRWIYPEFTQTSPQAGSTILM